MYFSFILVLSSQADTLLYSIAKIVKTLMDENKDPLSFGAYSTRVSSVKSSVGIFTHQGHISQVGSTLLVTNPGSIAN